MIKPVYDADGVTLYSGDCLSVMPTLKDRFDAVIADLPYATTRNMWDKPMRFNEEPVEAVWEFYEDAL